MGEYDNDLFPNYSIYWGFSSTIDKVVKIRYNIKLVSSKAWRTTIDILILVCEIGHFTRDAKRDVPLVRALRTNAEELASLNWEPKVGDEVPDKIGFVEYDEFEGEPDDWRVVAIFPEGQEFFALLNSLLAFIEATEGETLAVERLLAKVGAAFVGLSSVCR